MTMFEAPEASMLFINNVSLLVAFLTACFVVDRLIKIVSEWRRRYALLSALPTPKPKGPWLYHLRDVLDSPRVKSVDEEERKNVNAWTLLVRYCEEMVVQRDLGGFIFCVFSPSRLPFLTKSSFFVVDHELVQSVVRHPDLQTKGNTYDVAKDLIGKESVLVVPSGHDWKRMRRLTSKAFSNKIMMKVHEASIDVLHKKVFPYIMKKKCVEMVHLLNHYALDLLGIVSFSYNFGGIDGLIRDMQDDLQESERESNVDVRKQDEKINRIKGRKSVSQLFNEIKEDIITCTRTAGIYKPPRLRRNVRAFDDVIHSVIDARLNSPSERRGDLLDYLLEKDLATGNTMLSRDEILGNSKTFSFAGHDTTSHTLAALFFELSSHPEMVEKIRKEIDPYFAVGGAEDADFRCLLRRRELNDGPSYNDLRGCVYLGRVIREVLRLHPPALFSRMSPTKDVVLETSKFKYVVPKKTEIIISPWMSQRYCRDGGEITLDASEIRFDENGVEKRAQEKGTNVFNPDRIVDTSDPFFPFAIGDRNCVGREMALAEIRVTLAHVLHYFDLRTSKENVSENMEVYAMLTLHVANYKLEFVKRQEDME